MTAETNTAATTPPATENTEDGEDRFTRGGRIQAQLDPDLTEGLARALGDVAPDFARYTVEFPFGDIYARPGLDLRARQIATIAALATLGEQRQLEAHLRFALNIGVPREELVEVLMQMAVYAGWPRAINALYTARDLFHSMDQVPPTSCADLSRRPCPDRDPLAATSCGARRQSQQLRPPPVEVGLTGTSRGLLERLNEGSQRYPRNMVHNLHERQIHAPPDEVGALIDSLGGKNDRLWPRNEWPAMRLDGPLRVGAEGGHGPVRYFVTHYEPGRRVEFQFTGPAGFTGCHSFTALRNGENSTLLRHELVMSPHGRAVLTWPLFYRPLHDALIEESLDRAQRECGAPPDRPARRSLWTKMLRAPFSARIAGRRQRRP